MYVYESALILPKNVLPGSNASFQRLEQTREKQGRRKKALVLDSDSKLSLTYCCIVPTASGCCNVPPNGINMWNDWLPQAIAPAKVKHSLLPTPLSLYRALQVVYIIYHLCSHYFAVLTVLKSVHSHIFILSLYPKHMLGFLPVHFTGINTILTIPHLLFPCCFFFQQINQTPHYTDNYIVLINLNLHWMSLEWKFLFLIQGNLESGADWINHSRFPYSGYVNLRGMSGLRS